MPIFGTTWKWKIHIGSFRVSFKEQNMSLLLSREMMGKLLQMRSNYEYDDNRIYAYFTFRFLRMLNCPPYLTVFLPMLICMWNISNEASDQT